MDRQLNAGQTVILAMLPVAGFSIAVLAGGAAALAGFGHRWGWWHYRTGFAVLKWSAYGGIVAAVVSLAGIIVTGPMNLKQGLLFSAAAIVIGVVTAGLPWSWMRTVQQVPSIHDITTDTDDPPLFVAVLPLRKDAPNPAAYGGSEIAGQQRAAYPDIKPRDLPLPPGLTFEKALDAAKGMGWAIVAADAREGRIEATDTTFWFGFKDDVVIRIVSAKGGSRVDVRSLSRVGKSDVGTNAKRIRAYFSKLDRLAGEGR